MQCARVEKRYGAERETGQHVGCHPSGLGLIITTVSRSPTCPFTEGCAARCSLADRRFKTTWVNLAACSVRRRRSLDHQSDSQATAFGCWEFHGRRDGRTQVLLRYECCAPNRLLRDDVACYLSLCLGDVLQLLPFKDSKPRARTERCPRIVCAEVSTHASALGVGGMVGETDAKIAVSWGPLCSLTVSSVPVVRPTLGGTDQLANTKKAL